MNFGKVTQEIKFNFNRRAKLYLPAVKALCTIDAIAFKENGDVRWAQFGRVNGVTNEGFNIMLDSMFKNGTATLYPTWYLGLISNSGYSALNAGDTMSSHSGWTEDSTHYTAATRPAWTPGTAASKSTTNSSSVNFAMNLDNTIIKGIFVSSDSALAGTGGKLWATGLFSADQTLYNGDTLKITYTVTLS